MFCLGFPQGGIRFGGTGSWTGLDAGRRHSCGWDSRVPGRSSTRSTLRSRRTGAPGKRRARNVGESRSYSRTYACFCRPSRAVHLGKSVTGVSESLPVSWPASKSEIRANSRPESALLRIKAGHFEESVWARCLTGAPPESARKFLSGEMGDRQRQVRIFAVGSQTPGGGEPGVGKYPLE